MAKIMRKHAKVEIFWASDLVQYSEILEQWYPKIAGMQEMHLFIAEVDKTPQTIAYSWK